MRILLDTHIALWAVVGSRRLVLKAREVILAADEVLVSVASLWEIAIKHGSGKGDMPFHLRKRFWLSATQATRCSTFDRNMPSP